MSQFETINEALEDYKLDDKIQVEDFSILRFNATMASALLCFLGKLCMLYHANERRFRNYLGKGFDKLAEHIKDIKMFKGNHIRLDECAKCAVHPTLYYCSPVTKHSIIDSVGHLCLLCWIKEEVKKKGQMEMMEVMDENENGETAGDNLLQCFNLCTQCGQRRKWLIIIAGLELNTCHQDEYLMHALMKKAYLGVLHVDVHLNMVNTDQYFINLVLAHFLSCLHKINVRVREMFNSYYAKTKLNM